MSAHVQVHIHASAHRIHRCVRTYTQGLLSPLPKGGLRQTGLGQEGGWEGAHGWEALLNPKNTLSGLHDSY